jgi:MoaA/NifB/PqqE/SkfB family radical SAM enzyme
MAGLQATIPAYAFSFAKYMALKNLNHLILHVTNACNFRCEHCFIDFSPKKDLTFDEITRLAAEVKDLLWLDIAGGEPFLRKDLADIVALFNFGIVQIPTNGFYTDRIVDSLKQMRAKVGNKVNLTLSLDGLEATHNKIRGQANSWQRVWETFEQVRSLGFPVKINTVITNSNYDELIPLMRYVRERGPDFHSMILLRGDTIDPNCELPSLEKLRELAGPMFEILDSYSFGREGFATRVMQNYVRTLWSVSLQTIEEQRQVMPCQAGKFHQVVYGNGDVSSCEMLPPVGNVRQKSWSDIVASSEFKAQVRSIERGECHCTHNCAMLGSILFRPGPALKLAAKSALKV